MLRFPQNVILALWVGIGLSVWISIPTVYAGNPKNEQEKLNEEHSMTLEEADQFFQAQEWEKAVRAYGNIIKGDVYNGQAWFQFGLSLHYMKRYEDAIKAYQQAEKLEFSVPFAKYNIACAYALLNEKDNALTWLSTAINSGFDLTQYLASDPDLDSLRDDPRFQELLKNVESGEQAIKIAERFLENKEWEKAADAYKKILDRTPTSGPAWFFYALSLHYQSKHTEAINAYQEAIKFKHMVTLSEYNIACAYAQMNQKDEAFLWLEKALSSSSDQISYFLKTDTDLDPLRSDERFQKILEETQPNANHQDQAQEALKPNDWENAAKMYQKMVQEDDSNGEAFFQLGYARHMVQQYEEAVAAFQKAEKLGYHIAVTRYNMTCGYAMLKQGEEALNTLKLAIEAGFDDLDLLKADPDLQNIREDKRFIEILSSVEKRQAALQDADEKFQTQDWEKSAQAYQNILNDNPNDGRSWFNLGYSLHMTKQYPSAIEAYKKADALEYVVAITRYNIACAYALLNQKEEAFDWLNKALSAGFQEIEQLKRDEDLAGLKNDERFTKIIERLEKGQKI